MKTEISNFLPSDADVFNISYKDWIISKWTGWKENRRSPLEFSSCDLIDNRLFGQWIAWRPIGKGREWLYVSVPGGEGRFSMGEAFDIEPKEGQAEITSVSSPEDKQAAKIEGYKRMTRLIDSLPERI